MLRHLSAEFVELSKGLLVLESVTFKLELGSLDDLTDTVHLDSSL